ncbi:hypothetical protein BB560_002321 [Smittium megazygosporum]|uniref:Uncharacterized protein n=1 Tax=Smittium megazygosporum TaxID=133381 RepID=A0A2T9ZF93_9FUNG|nr:hypothetical protein BB560_002321 [Smittium megazygosporum]
MHKKLTRLSDFEYNLNAIKDEAGEETSSAESLVSNRSKSKHPSLNTSRNIKIHEIGISGLQGKGEDSSHREDRPNGGQDKEEKEVDKVRVATDALMMITQIPEFDKKNWEESYRQKKSGGIDGESR